MEVNSDPVACRARSQGSREMARSARRSAVLLKMSTAAARHATAVNPSATTTARLAARSRASARPSKRHQQHRQHAEHAIHHDRRHRIGDGHFMIRQAVGADRVAADAGGQERADERAHEKDSKNGSRTAAGCGLRADGAARTSDRPSRRGRQSPAPRRSAAAGASPACRRPRPRADPLATACIRAAPERTPGGTGHRAKRCGVCGPPRAQLGRRGAGAPGSKTRFTGRLAWFRDGGPDRASRGRRGAEI